MSLIDDDDVRTEAVRILAYSEVDTCTNSAPAEWIAVITVNEFDLHKRWNEHEYY